MAVPPRSLQMAITRDNVSISIDGVLYVKVIDSYKAAYGVEDPHFAITQLAQTTMRSEIGKISLDNTFKERETLNGHIVRAINSAALDWGISCMRYEIRDISPPKAVRAARASHQLEPCWRPPRGFGAERGGMSPHVRMQLYTSVLLCT